MSDITTGYIDEAMQFISWMQNLEYDKFLSIWPEDNWKQGKNSDKRPYHFMYEKFLLDSDEFWLKLDLDNKNRLLKSYVTETANKKLLLKLYIDEQNQFDSSDSPNEI